MKNIECNRMEKEVIFDKMSMKIRVSYENQQELHTVLRLLHPIVLSYKAEKGEKGRYKKAYLEVRLPEK